MTRILRLCDCKNGDTFKRISRVGKERGRANPEEDDEWIWETINLGC